MNSIFIIQPFVRVSLWDRCKEYMHVKHFMYWALFPLQFILFYGIESLWKNCQLVWYDFLAFIIPQDSVDSEE